MPASQHIRAKSEMGGIVLRSITERVSSAAAYDVTMAQRACFSFFEIPPLGGSCKISRSLPDVLKGILETK
jgi:hypothetical protein